jgi:hypothetical protein
MANRDYNNVLAAAKFYGATCILLTLGCLSLLILCFKKSITSPNDSHWAKKYDSLYVVSKQNELQWDTFHKKSKGYYFVNPTEKKGIKNFDLIKFVEE